MTLEYETCYLMRSLNEMFAAERRGDCEGLRLAEHEVASIAMHTDVPGLRRRAASELTNRGYYAAMNEQAPL